MFDSGAKPGPVVAVDEVVQITPVAAVCRAGPCTGTEHRAAGLCPTPSRGIAAPFVGVLFEVRHVHRSRAFDFVEDLLRERGR